jgi:hypothetical protein
MKHDGETTENVDSFNFGDSPIRLAFPNSEAFIYFGEDPWRVPAADLHELANGLKRLGYGGDVSQETS